MATHSSIITWKISWTEEPGRLQWMGRQINGESERDKGLPWWLSGKESPASAGDAGSVPELGRSPGEGNGNPLQYYCLGDPLERGAWWVIVHGVTKTW